MKLDDDDGLPRTAYMKLGWSLLLLLASSGTILLFLSVYLAAWIRSKGRSAIPLHGFTGASVIFIGVAILDYLQVNTNLSEVVASLGVFTYLLCTFALRWEIIRYFRETQNWEPRINLFLTLVLSSVYLNECLSPDRIPQQNTLTTLNL